MAKVLNIDAKELVAGRLASFVAKQALLGYEVNIFNCESAVITGAPHAVQKETWRRRVDLGQPMKGPYISRIPDRFVRRIIRGMLPYKKTRGKEAYERIMCYVGVTIALKDAKLQSLPWAHASRLNTTKVQTVGKLCQTLGWKQ